MTTEMWIIAAFRIASALPVLRWPLAGAFIALFADLGDLFLREWLDLGGVQDYQRFDKWLDQAYMLTFLIVAFRWEALPRNIAVALFAFREVGVIAFEITGDRDILLLFPNLFEYWFIFIAALKTFGWEETPQATHKEPGARSATMTRDLSPATSELPLASDISHLSSVLRFAIPYRYTGAQLALALTVILTAKLFHEYTLHVGQWFESFTPNEALEAIWQFLTPPY